MAELQKAMLQKVKADENQTPDGAAVPVQFNPTSLKLKLTNQSDGGRSKGRQSRQNNGQSSTVLSMDLVFDSADEGTAAGDPVSVREKTSLIEQFVLPKEGSSKPPPLLRFEWDKLIIIGLVESLDIEFDHFAANGAPLRAKMGVSIKEQEPKYAFLKQGKGQKKSDTAEKPDANKTSPGGGTNDTAGNNKNSDRSNTVLDGESAPEFLARQGLDPAAWRGLDVDLSAGLSLEAGLEVGFSAGLNASVGVGVSVGVLAEVDVSLESSLGIGASTSSSKKINGDSAGLAIASAGGIQSAIETVKVNNAQSLASKTQLAFNMPATQSGNAPAVDNIKRSPLQTEDRKTASLINSKGSSGNPAEVNTPGVVKADPRSTSYGYGVPLRPLYAAALNQEQVYLCRVIDNNSGPQFRKHKTTAPWEALPKRDQTRALADQAEASRRQHPCDFINHSFM